MHQLAAHGIWFYEQPGCDHTREMGHVGTGKSIARVVAAMSFIATLHVSSIALLRPSIYGLREQFHGNHAQRSPAR